MTFLHRLSIAVGLFALSAGCSDPVASTPAPTDAAIDAVVDRPDVKTIPDVPQPDRPDVPTAPDDVDGGSPQDADVTVPSDAEAGPQDADVTPSIDADVTPPDGTPPDVTPPVDGPGPDVDAGPVDTGPTDAGPVDAGPPRMTFTFVSAALSGGTAGGPQMRATITWHGMLRGENDAGVRLEAFFR